MPDSIEYTIHISDEYVKDMLVARLADAGASGFEEQKNVLKAFVLPDNTSLTMFDEIIEQASVKYSKSIIKEQNWNAVWEADFRPVTVGEFCFVRAAFHAPNPRVKLDVVITPKMSFGTGHHATTFLMIQAMEKINLAGAKVFDFGTGTGVLAIIAEKCGAKQVFAIDNDDWSINNAIENFNVNDCRNIMISKAEGIYGKLAYDCIMANINRNVILENLAKIPQHLVKNGVLLLSGLLQGDEQQIVAKAIDCGLALMQKTEMNGWICLLMVKS